MPTTTKPQKNALDIRLAESVVFLRAGDATGRLRNMQIDAPPGMLRGLLTLTLIKPTKISSIELVLVGKTSTAWPEGAWAEPLPFSSRFSSYQGVGARRIEVNEEHEIYAQSYVLFRAGSETPYRNSRRTLSVGPGLALDHDDDDRSEASSEDLHSSTMGEERRGRERGRERGPPPALLNTAYASRRNMSVDQTYFQRDYIAHYDNGFSRTTASPPYTPVAETGPAHMFSPLTLSPAASISHRMHTVDELTVQEAASELGQRSR